MQFDFDFQRYVERRKGKRDAESREGAAYAYAGDTRVLRTLDKVKPVGLAVEATVKLWHKSARAELLGPAVKAGERNHPRVHAAAQRAAERLHVGVPTVWVAPGLPVEAAAAAERRSLAAPGAYTFGTDDEPALLLEAALVDELDDKELDFVLGAELGHAQNHHVLYRTAHYFLVHSAGTFLRWIVKPAVAALDAWSRRGEVTADRAGLLACRDLDAALSALVKVAVTAADRREGFDVAALVADVKQASSGPADGKRLVHYPFLPRRAAALRVFAESAYYRGVLGQEGGYAPEACDARVAEILSAGAM